MSILPGTICPEDVLSSQDVLSSPLPKMFSPLLCDRLASLCDRLATAAADVLGNHPPLPLLVSVSCLCLCFGVSVWRL
jgi:hypothetical protein